MTDDRTNKVTIVARNMPGDPPSLGWSSPWAGAMWLPSAGDKGEEKDFPVVSYVKFRELAEQEPECSVVVSLGSEGGHSLTNWLACGML